MNMEGVWVLSAGDLRFGIRGPNICPASNSAQFKTYLQTYCQVPVAILTPSGEWIFERSLKLSKATSSEINWG